MDIAAHTPGRSSIQFAEVQKFMNVAICDDAFQDRTWMLRATDAYLQQHGIQAAITTFESGCELLNAKREFDLYLLDIVMPEMNGIELAMQIRRTNKRSSIIFITSSAEYAIDGYSVNAAGYLLKPPNAEQFSSQLNRLFQEGLLASEQTIPVVCDRIDLQLAVSQIVYAESMLHQILVHILNGDSLRLHQKLDEFEESLKPYAQFQRCHKSYLVNLDCADAINGNSFSMSTGAVIPISRNSYAQSKLAYYNNKVNWLQARYD